MALDVAVVTQLKGQAWIRNEDGSLNAIREGMRIPAGVEIVTERGGNVTLQPDHGQHCRTWKLSHPSKAGADLVATAWRPAYLRH